jgi:dTMP kinase
MSNHKGKKQLTLSIEELLEKHEKKRGLLIAFEGLDGAGKTTQRKLFRQWLKSAGYETVTTKWNSSSLIKPLLQVRKEARSLTPEEFCLLHAADMRHRLETLILPALWQGKTVIADRWFFTALARDGARGLPLNWLLNVYSPVFWPDMVFYFSISLETSRKRLFATRKPKFYQTGQDVTLLEDPFASYLQFMGRVHHEYEALKMIFQFMQVDAEGSIYEQHQHIRLLFRQAQRRPWAEWNTEILEEWLARNPQLTEVPGAR